MGDKLIVRQAKHDSTDGVPLTVEGKADLDAYINWLTIQIGQTSAPDQQRSPKYLRVKGFKPTRIGHDDISVSSYMNIN